MNGDTQDDVKAAEYVLGLLSVQERVEFEREMVRRPELRAIMWRWQEMMSRLDTFIEPVEPPETLWRRIESAISTKRSSHVVRRVMGWTGWTGWAVAAVLAGFMLFRPATSPLSQPVAILSASDGQSQFIVSASAGSHTLTVSGLNVPAANTHSLQLWLLKENAAPVSLGLLDTTPVVLKLNASQLNQPVRLAVSQEPKGGAPGSLPTGPVLYTGSITTGVEGI